MIEALSAQRGGLPHIPCHNCRFPFNGKIAAAMTYS